MQDTVAALRSAINAAGVEIFEGNHNRNASARPAEIRLTDGSRVVLTAHQSDLSNMPL